MAETKTVRMVVSRGSPTSGAIIRAGAVVELPVFWADKFLSEGAAELVEAEAPKPEAAKSKKKK